MVVDVFQKMCGVAAGKIIVSADNHCAVMRNFFNLAEVAVNFGVDVIQTAFKPIVGGIGNALNPTEKIKCSGDFSS